MVIRDRLTQYVLALLCRKKGLTAEKAPEDVGFIRPVSSSSCAENSQIRAAAQNSESEGNSSISVLTLKGVCWTGYIRSTGLSKSPQLEVFVIPLSPCL